MSEKVDRAIHALKTNPILMNKYAELGPIARAVGLQLGVAGAGALAFAGVAKGMEALSHAKANMQKSKNLARILAVNPELRTVDPTKLSLAYNTLVRVSPKIAVDPLLAGQFMRNTLQVSSMSGMHVNTQDLATLAKLHDGKVHPIAEQFGAQLRGPMGAYTAGQLLALEGQEQRAINQDIRQQAQEARQGELHPGALAAQQFAAQANARQQELHPGALDAQFYAAQRADLDATLAPYTLGNAVRNAMDAEAASGSSDPRPYMGTYARDYIK